MYYRADKGRTIENDGQRPKYIVENSHEAIISKTLFEALQQIKKHED